MPPSGLVPALPFQALATDRPEDIFRFVQRGMAQGKKAALVFLTEIIGGAARALGAPMGILEDGAYCGFVSGGCVEAAVAFEGLKALQAGKDRFCRFGKGAPHFDIVLPCGGGIGLSVHVLREDTALRLLFSFLQKREEAYLCYHPQTETLSVHKGQKKTGWEDGVFFRACLPAPRLFLSGGHYEAGILADIAQKTGLETCFPQDSTAQENLKILAQFCDKRTAIALLHHDPEKEMPPLKAALETKAFYIGCLGSRRTHEKRLIALQQSGIPADQITRIHAPIGLFGPARTADSLAISILAEILAALPKESAPPPRRQSFS